MISNFFGHGNSTESDSLNIDLQFNFSLPFSRNTGGVFLRDREDNSVVLAHRGIVTRGKSRVNKQALLDEIMFKVEDVSAQQSRKLVRVIPVAPIEAQGIIGYIDRFCVEMRRAASLVAERKARGISPKTLENSRFGGGKKSSPELGGYFDEFSGHRTMSARQEYEAYWRHGVIVSALKKYLRNSYELRKNQSIDLAAIDDQDIIFFEVKTSTNWQSLYCAIGQLQVHSAAFSINHPRLRVKKVLVVPIDITEEQRRTLRSLDIELLGFRLTKGKYRFSSAAGLIKT